MHTIARSPAYEGAVTRITYLCRPRILAVSATLSNPDDIGRWLKVPKEQIYCFDGSTRPVPLEIIVEGCGGYYSSSTSSFSSSSSSSSSEYLFDRYLSSRVWPTLRGRLLEGIYPRISLNISLFALILFLSISPFYCTINSLAIVRRTIKHRCVQCFFFLNISSFPFATSVQPYSPPYPHLRLQPSCCRGIGQNSI